MAEGWTTSKNVRDSAWRWFVALEAEVRAEPAEPTAEEIAEAERKWLDKPRHRI